MYIKCLWLKSRVRNLDMVLIWAKIICLCVRSVLYGPLLFVLKDIASPFTLIHHSLCSLFTTCVNAHCYRIFPQQPYWNLYRVGRGILGIIRSCLKFCFTFGTNVLSVAIFVCMTMNWGHVSTVCVNCKFPVFSAWIFYSTNRSKSLQKNYSRET